MFAKNKTAKDGLKNICRKCDSIRAKEWYAENREKRLQSCKKYRENNLELCKNRTNTYYKNNKEKIKVYQKQYRDSDKSKGASKRARYRAKLSNRTPKWLSKEDLKLIDAKYAIARWLSIVVGVNYEVDHIVPLNGRTVSGLHVPHNLSIVKESENRAKGNRFKL